MTFVPRSPSTRRLVAAGRQWWHRSIGGHGLRRMRELDLDTHALALCAQQVLCTAPLIVAMSAGLQSTTRRGAGHLITPLFRLVRGPAAHGGPPVRSPASPVQNP